MAKTISVAEVALHFAEYINRVAYRGERFVLVRGNKPMAELRPLPTGKRLEELPALLASLPHLSSAEATQLATSRRLGRSLLVQRSTIRGSLD